MLFPAAAMVLACACAVVMAISTIRRATPAKISWLVAFTLFAIAAACELIGATAGWTPVLVRAYYVSGAVLVVGFLALGELYLLVPERVTRVAPGAALLATALSIALVWDAPIDTTRLATEGWRAMERGPALAGLAALINGLGSVVVIAGAGWSAWVLWKKGGSRSRAVGCGLIAIGVLIVASGGWLTRFGRPEFLYLSMAIGVALIFAGCLETQKSGRSAARSIDTVAEQDASVAAPGLTAASSATAPAASGTVRSDRLAVLRLSETAPAPVGDEAAGLMSRWLDELSDAELASRARDWSATADGPATLDRAMARRVWGLYLALPESGRRRLESLPPATQWQLAEVYHEVLLAPTLPSVPDSVAS